MCNAKIQPQPTETLTVCSDSSLLTSHIWFSMQVSRVILLACCVRWQQRCSVRWWARVENAREAAVVLHGGHWKRACKKGGQKLPPELFSFAKTLNSLCTFTGIWKRETWTLAEEIHWNKGGNSALTAGLTLLPHLALPVSLLQTNNPNSLVTRGHSPGLFLNKHQNTCTCQTL